MSFGFEQQKFPIPRVEAPGTKHGVITAFPKWKYHEDYAQGLIVNDAAEEIELGDGWVDSPAGGGCGTHPGAEKLVAGEGRLASVKTALAAVEKAKADREAKAAKAKAKAAKE